ncbi:hypothetical protein [Butyrivibrio sp. MC2013]|uniref:hypothetical protein n=1 Tax=Butyrivibrio sp. MC2013 TaxID=1280686 RepID=UPI00040199A8|nr:hypothetical protein [Butyrivibrio sp. MC2013]
MNNDFVIQLIGYLGSALVLISFLMVSVYKLRIVNSIGSVVCVIYGLIIGAYPTVVMNLCLVAINIYYLMKSAASQKNYDFIRVSPSDGLVQHMIERNRADILKCFPGTSLDFSEADTGFAVCHDGLPVGIMLGKLSGGELRIMLDYSVLPYRDFSIGRFLLSRLRGEGIAKLIYIGDDTYHKAYLRETGFVRVDDHYEKEF